MDLTNWRFRRSLESMASYPESKPFRVEIERGSREVLAMVMREIEMLLAEPNENPFAKELMLLGSAHVIAALERLMPLLMKICSYRLDSQDTNRGITYFQSHPNYLKATPEEKEQLKLLGSSLHIICLESVKAWAEWVPVSPNGTESAFKRGYSTLLERGVIFNVEQQYYKQTDYQKFSNTYKVEFFDESEAADEPSEADFSTVPVVESEINRIQRLRKDLLAMLSQNKPTAPQDLERFVARIDQFHRQDIGKLERLIQSASRNEYQKKMSLETLFKEQNWAETVLGNYSLLTQGKISWQQFAAKCMNYQEPQVRDLPVTVTVPQQEINIQTAFRKPSQQQIATPLNESSPINSAYVKLEQSNTELKASLKQQKNTYEGIVYQLEVDSNKRKQEIAQLKQELVDRERQVREECESRLNNLKMTYSSDPRKDLALQENTELKESMRKLNEQLMGLRRNKVEAPLQGFMQAPPSPDVMRLTQQLRRSEEQLRQSREACRLHSQQLQEANREKSRLQTKSRELLDQLQQQRQAKNELVAEVRDLRRTLAAAKDIEEQMVGEMKKMEITLAKTIKDNSNLQNEVAIYKQQLAEMRGKSHQEMKLESQKSEEAIFRLTRDLQELTKQNSELKQQQTQAKLEISRLTELQQRKEREATVMQLQTPPRQLQVDLPRELTDRSARTHQTNFGGDFQNDRILFNTASNGHSRSRSPFGLSNERLQPNYFQVAGMEEFQQYFIKMPRESYIRFCRSCLKNKELLYKENELEIGVISERLSSSKLRLLLHYTNNADVPLKDFKARLYSPRTVRTTVVSDVGSIIESAEQEKEEITHQVLEYPVRRVSIELSYEYLLCQHRKNGRNELLALVLPVLFLKFVEYAEPSRTGPASRLLDSRSCRINTKVMPRGKNIKAYIPQFHESPKDVSQTFTQVFEANVLHRESSLSFHLQLRQRDELLEMTASSDQLVLTPQQLALLGEYMSNLQMVLGH